MQSGVSRTHREGVKHPRGQAVEGKNFDNETQTWWSKIFNNFREGGIPSVFSGGRGVGGDILSMSI